MGESLLSLGSPIGCLRSGPLEMVRAPVHFDQAPIFTPYLIHGPAFNDNDTKTRMALEIRFNIVRWQR